MRSIKPAMYKMDSRGPRTDHCGTPNRTVFCVDRTEPRRTHFTKLVKYLVLEPVQRSTVDTEGDLEPCQRDVAVDGIKCADKSQQIKSNLLNNKVLESLL